MIEYSKTTLRSFSLLQGNSCGCPNNATSWTIHGLWYVSPRGAMLRETFLH